MTAYSVYVSDKIGSYGYVKELPEDKKVVLSSKTKGGRFTLVQVETMLNVLTNMFEKITICSHELTKSEVIKYKLTGESS